MQGLERRLEEERRRAAWVVANIVNVWLDKKDRVTVEQLLGKPRETSVPLAGIFETPEQMMAALAAAREERERAAAESDDEAEG